MAFTTAWEGPMSLKMLRELTKATSRVWRAGEVSSGYQRADGNLKIKKEK